VLDNCAPATLAHAVLNNGGEHSACLAQAEAMGWQPVAQAQWALYLKILSI
jgi:hypothetical protein